MGISEDIVAFSDGRPAWQRDALRRLASKGQLDATDMDELFKLCVRSHGLDLELPHSVAAPLTLAHLPAIGIAGVRLRLLDVRAQKNVNALANDQEIAFAPDGLTVIYGDNGTGKSGYVRILKKVCRARGADTPILPNIFGGQSTDIPEATISFQLDSTSSKFLWSPDTVAPEELSYASVFDSYSGSVYVTSEHDVAYMPFGLDVLPKLAEACAALKVRIEREIASQPKLLDACPEKFAATKVGAWVRGLSGQTTDTAVNEAAILPEDLRVRMQQVAKILSEPQPEQRALEVDEKRGRFQRLLTRLQELGTIYSTETIRHLIELQARIVSLEAGRGSTFEHLETSIPLDLFLSEEWESFWDAASHFAEHVKLHSNLNSFPMEDGDHCLLCQAALSSDGKQALGILASERNQRLSSELSDAKREYHQAKDRIASLRLSDAVIDTIRELALTHTLIATESQAYVDRCAQVQADVAETGASPLNFEGFTSGAAPLAELLEELSHEASDLRSSADPSRRTGLEMELLELEARLWSDAHVESIRQEIGRLTREGRLKEALAETSTTGITRRSSELTQQYVTDELRASFARELAAITGRTPRVGLVGRPGERGVSHYRLQLVDPTISGAKIEHVVSEGEFRSVSLAAFLSELSTETTNSCVVYDDPVSSLDMENRERVALRLSELAETRQVIVFTHDVAFLTGLMEESRKRGTSIATSSLTRTPAGAGVVLDDIPWEAQKFTKQVSTLNERCANLKVSGLSMTG